MPSYELVMTVATISIEVIMIIKLAHLVHFAWLLLCAMYVTHMLLPKRDIILPCAMQMQDNALTSSSSEESSL